MIKNLFAKSQKKTKFSKNFQNYIKNTKKNKKIKITKKLTIFQYL